MEFQEEIIIQSTPNKVFSLYRDVRNWPSWDPDVKASTIEGEFTTGAVGSLTPSKGPKSKIYFRSIEENESFTVESKLPFCKMTFEHTLTPKNDATKVIHRVVFDGALSFLFSRIIGSQIKKGLPNTLQGLKKACEA